MFLFGALIGLFIGLIAVLIVIFSRDKSSNIKSPADEQLTRMRQRGVDYFNNPIVDYMKRNKNN